jgi:membrane-associated progesterone receptor component
LGVVVAELWQAARAAPPGTVVAAVAAAAVVYKVASGLLAPPTPPPQRRVEVAEEALPPAPEPVQVGEITADELRQYDGSDPEKPLLMAIKGQIYDISQSRSTSFSHAPL